MAVKPLMLEALGDDFAQLSGEWIENARVVSHLQEAHGVWAFSAKDEADVQRQMAALPIEQGWQVIGLSPGANPQWGPEGREVLLRLLGGLAAPGDIVGLLLAIDAPTCACPHRQGGKNICGGCAECHAGNGGDQALYACEERKKPLI